VHASICFAKVASAEIASIEGLFVTEARDNGALVSSEYGFINQ